MVGCLSSEDIRVKVAAEDKPKYRFFIPVYFYNLARYDSKHIFRYFNPRVAAEYGKDEDEEEDEHPPNIQIIGLNLEQFISFDIFYLRFIDTVKFLSASLESLVNNLVVSCDKPFDKFTHTRDRLKPDAEAEKLIFAKGVFPYEFFDSLKKFEDLQLPGKTLFTVISLKKESVMQITNVHMRCGTNLGVKHSKITMTCT